MIFARVLQVVVLLVVLAGCSRVQFAYNQLDWVIPDYLETYVDFSEEQRVMLDDRVDALLNWNCSTQVATYAAMLRSANNDLQSGTMSKERLEEYRVQLEGHWQAIMSQASPGIADVLVTLSDEQVDGVFAVFKDKNEEWLEDFEDETDEERRDRYRERMTDELERWLGPLGWTQQRAVLDWSNRLMPLGLLGLQARQQWQANLREVMGNRDDEAAFRAGIEELFVNARALRAPAIQERFEENRVLGLGLIQTVGAHLDDEQRTHLASEVASVAGDLDELVCDPEPPTARKQEDNGTGGSPPEDARSDS